MRPPAVAERPEPQGTEVRGQGGRPRVSPLRTAVAVAVGIALLVLLLYHAGVDDILRHCNAALPAFKAPKRIVLSDALPKTERGKLDRKALVERWRSKAGS